MGGSGSCHAYNYKHIYKSITYLTLAATWSFYAVGVERLIIISVGTGKRSKKRLIFRVDKLRVESRNNKLHVDIMGSENLRLSCEIWIESISQ